ncbi:hypothetical protein M378DRAFT_16904 [Amanita muscaria Koide BX008]|uniref:Uncharacterized protein n=1 Tax=Amanita muscaria (strain Koide BX008) TaxID=946122 RepID=A0A0C2WKF4_AMAMK|nr:hypothetical protein M378DRAFT_16904 [Amanita muscaria Koide BX008]
MPAGSQCVFSIWSPLMMLSHTDNNATKIQESSVLCSSHNIAGHLSLFYPKLFHYWHSEAQGCPPLSTPPAAPRGLLQLSTYQHIPLAKG